MNKFIMTMRFYQDVDFEVEANNYNDAVTQAYDLANDFPNDALNEIHCELRDWDVEYE